MLLNYGEFGECKSEQAMMDLSLELLQGTISLDTNWFGIALIYLLEYKNIHKVEAKMPILIIL